jgi:hypothetical protein
LGELFYFANNKSIQQLSEGVFQYVQKFGQLSCCSDDIKPLLNFLDTANARSLGLRLKKQVSWDSQVTVELIRFNINLLSTIQYLEKQTREQSDSSSLENFIMHYRNSQSIMVKDERERCHGDDFLYLAAVHLIDCFSRDRSIAHLTRYSRTNIASYPDS